jgi:flagellar hook-associated protein 2
VANTISFSGLGSGVDTNSIVDELIRLERVPITNVQTRQDREKTKQQALNDIASRISTLRSNAEALTSVAFWNGVPHGTSGDEDSYAVTANAAAAKASYSIKVLSLAKADVHVQTATAGIRQFGAVNFGAGTFASKATPLTAMTTSGGTNLGLAAGQTITLSGTKGGSPLTGSLTITEATTLDNLRAFVETSIPGASVKLDTGGRITITSPSGTDQEVTGLSLSTGGAAPLFDTQFASSTQTRAAAGIGTIQANDTLTLTAGTLTFDVAVTAGMTMQQVAQAINAANGGVNAAVTDGRLRIAGTGTGTAAQVSIASAGGTAGQLGLVNSVDAADAQVEVDGVVYTSDSNEATTIIPGATLTLKRASTDATTATTDPTWVDKDEAVSRVKALVDQYNSVVDLIQTKTTEKRVPDATTTADQMKGSLFANTTLATIRTSLQSAFINPISGLSAGNNLGSVIGISGGAFGTGNTADTMAGKIKFDAAKFEALFTQDREAARRLLDADGPTSAEDGIATRIANLTKSFTQTGGLLQASIDGSGEQVKRLQDQIDRMNDRVTREEERLKNQFLAMERAISQLQSAQSGIAGLSSLSASQQSG